MADDIEFVDGLIIKEPHERAPPYIMAKVSINVPKLRRFLDNGKAEWINADVENSRGGVWEVCLKNKTLNKTDDEL